MKKKLLPFILGCAVLTAMPLSAHATTTQEYANEIPTSGTTPASGDESLNGFTEYNDTQGAANSLAQTFTGSTSTGSGLGNTRSSASNVQSAATVTNKNEQQNYRSSGTTTLAQDLAANNFNEVTNDTAGTTDLETSIPEFNMTIPASTVLPIGATRWRIGNVKIEGKDFVRPDKIQLLITKQNFHHSDYDSTAEGGEAAAANSGLVIPFNVTDRRYTSNSIVGSGNVTYFFQDGAHAGANGASTMQNTFPYSYTGYTSTDYQGGLVSEINETHQIWVLVSSSDWTSKTAGKYTGSLTFAASVVSDDNSSMYSSLYPGEGSETDPNATP